MTLCSSATSALKNLRAAALAPIDNRKSKIENLCRLAPLPHLHPRLSALSPPPPKRRGSNRTAHDPIPMQIHPHLRARRRRLISKRSVRPEIALVIYRLI